MKHLFSYIVFCLLFFNTAHAGNKYPLPEDFEGKETRPILQRLEADEEDATLKLKDQMVITYEAAMYLYPKYSMQDIAQESFIKKIRPFFPTYTDEQLESRRTWLYAGAGMYEYGKQKYTEFLKKHLVPPTYKKVRSVNDYDHEDDVSYIEVPEGEYVKVYNFRKFLTYSDNLDERKAIAEFEAAQNKGDVLEQLNQAVQKIEWEKLPFYGIKYDNPLYSVNAISPLQYTKYGSIRLVANGEFIENRTEVEIALLATLPDNAFVLANTLNFNLRKPQIDLSQSQNIAPDYQILYPVPEHSALYPELYKYTGTFMILAKVKPIDPEKNIIIRAQTDITECDYNLDCAPQHYTLVQTIEPHGNDLFGNGMENYFFRAHATIPQAESKHLKLKEFSVQGDQEAEHLYLEFESNKSVDTFSVFIEETDGYTTFKEPLVSLRDNRIFVRLEPSEKFASRDLGNSEYIITADLNGKYFWRQTLVPKSSSDINVLTPNLGLGFFILAFIAGLLLNFMPCVLPIWAYKLLSMFRLHKKTQDVIHSDIKQMFAGVVMTSIAVFIFLVFTAAYFKPYIFGEHLQNQVFLMTILFGGMLLIQLLPYLISEALSDKMRYLNYVLGMVICFAAISCGAPYLSEVMTTAANTDIPTLCWSCLLILCGFCLPYVIGLKIKSMPHLLRFVHTQKRYVHILIRYALYFSYIWYILHIYWQTGFIYTLKVAIASVIFWLVINITIKFLQYLDGVLDEDISEKDVQKIKCGTYVFMTLMTFGFILIASISGAHRQAKEQLRNSEQAAVINQEEIAQELQQKHSVLVAVETDWCLRCRLNNILTFNSSNLQKWAKQHHLKYIHINPTKSADTINYLKRFNGRVDIPSYVLYTPIIQNGIILPSQPNLETIERILIHNQTR